MTVPFCCNSRYFVEVDPFGSLQYKLHLPTTFAGICCGGGACPSATPVSITPKTKPSTKYPRRNLFTESSFTAAISNSLQKFRTLSHPTPRLKIKSSRHPKISLRLNRRDTRSDAEPLPHTPHPPAKSGPHHRRRHSPRPQILCPTPIRRLHRPAARRDEPHRRPIPPAILRSCHLHRHLPRRPLCLRRSHRHGRQGKSHPGPPTLPLPHRLRHKTHHLRHHLLPH